ncbi:SUMO1 sentrin specific peptidase 8 [Homalodisca vitripennis]|nr:SUMO1 sentrin specific peptidase 8 [Homalodisca vitripennis]
MSLQTRFLLIMKSAFLSIIIISSSSTLFGLSQLSGRFKQACRNRSVVGAGRENTLSSHSELRSDRPCDVIQTTCSRHLQASYLQHCSPVCSLSLIALTDSFSKSFLSCNVPPGWERVEKKRPSGLTAGRIDVSYISPGGKTVSSKGDLEKYIRKKGLKLDVNAFNFSAGAKKKGRTMSSAESSTSQSPNSETSITTPIESLDGTESVSSKKSCIILNPLIVHGLKNLTDSSFLTEHHDLKSKNVVIMPVDDSEDLYTVGHGTHWSTLVYDRAANKFFYLDSVKNLNLPAAKIVAQKLASHLGLDIETSEFVSLKSPQQSNGFDYGVFVCWNVESLVQDITMDSALNFGLLQNATITAKEVITKRLLIAYVLYSSLQITKEELYDLMIKKPGKRHEEGQYTTNVLEKGERRQGGDSQWFKVASSRHYGQKQRGPAKFQLPKSNRYDLLRPSKSESNLSAQKESDTANLKNFQKPRT